MATRYFWIGTQGPFAFQDAADATPSICPDKNLVYDGAAAPNAAGVVTSGQLTVGTQASLDEEVLRLVDNGDITGDVVGPGAATDEAIARWDGATGALLQDSGVIIDDNDDMILPGNLTFTGPGDGLVYGTCYGNHIGWTQAAAAQNTWYNIVDANMVSGLLNKVTHDGNGKLTVTEPGVFFVTYAVTMESDHANEHIDCGIEVSGSGSADAAGISHLETKFASQEGHLSGVALLDLADNATLEIAIQTTDAGTPDLFVQDINFVVFQIGGT